MESILHYLGYTDRSSPGAEEALRLLDETTSPIALVISDVVMPGDLDGDDLALIVSERHTDLPVVRMSGYAEQGIKKDALDRAIPLLSKPVSTETLQRVLRDKFNPSKTTVGEALGARKISDAYSHS